MTSLLFLDVDGVINPTSNYMRLKAMGKSRAPEKLTFPDDIMKRLKDIIDETGAKVVISSTWRCTDHNDKSVWDPTYKNLVNQLAKYDINIYGCTPVRHDRVRGKEILEYLEWFKCEVENNEFIPFIIIDDGDFDIEPFIPPAHIIKIAGNVGITDSDAEFAIYQLNKMKKLSEERAKKDGKQ